MISKSSIAAVVLLLSGLLASPTARAWVSDNGNGTFTNPLFQDEFSDPDLIRVGDDFYLTGTTMHTFPGLPVLHSKDLVNWDLLGYATPGLDYGPQYRLEDGKNIYGRGIWAPSFRYHNGTFYIFSNVNGRKTQLFTATNPAGPWTHREMKVSLHDLSVLFDDDGKVYVVWGNSDIHFAQLNQTLDDFVPGTERILIERAAGMCEGSHFYKINGKYYITSSWYRGRMRMPCARANRPEGPYEVNPEISADEEFGVTVGNRLINEKATDFQLMAPDPKRVGRLSMHQGGLVQTQTGQWWGFSMMDANSVGRLTCLSPVTWQDGWPWFGLPGNLERTPRTWVKPDTGHPNEKPRAPYRRDDSFAGPRLADIWQWNHMPVAGQWSLAERPGFLRLHALPAPDFWNARDTLTQRAIGPESTPAVELDSSGLKPGDIAGLGLLNYPYGWIGVSRGPDGFELRQFDQRTGKIASAPFSGGRVWLRAHCDFLSEKATFSYSTDGKTFAPLGGEFMMIYQGRTFQGIRYSLFSFNTGRSPGGFADFSNFTVDEPHPSGFTRPIPAGQTIMIESLGSDHALVVGGDTLASAPKSAATPFKVIGLPLGRVSLQAPDGRLVTVTGLGAAGRVSLEKARNSGDVSQSFQYEEMPRGDILFLSLASARYLRISEHGTVTADATGAQPDRKNGASLQWRDVSASPSQ